MTPADLRTLLAAATPGPWAWYGNTKTQTCYLATVGGGRVFVMQFDRWGMQNAQPTFQWPVGHADGSGTGVMYPMSKLPEDAGPDFEVSYRRDFVGIKHPDASLIVAAVNALPGLLDRIEDLETQVAIASRDLCGCLDTPDDPDAARPGNRTLMQIVEAVIGRIDELEAENRELRKELTRYTDPDPHDVWR